MHEIRGLSIANNLDYVMKTDAISWQILKLSAWNNPRFRAVHFIPITKEDLPKILCQSKQLLLSLIRL